MRRRVIRFLVPALCSAWFVAGCADEMPLSPTPAVAPQPTGGFPSGTWTVRGTVWVHDAGGAAPAGSGSVFAWVQRPTNGYSTGRGPIQPDGRYEIPIPSDTIRVDVQGPRFQPCATTVIPTGSDIADVHSVPDASLLNSRLPASVPVLPGRLSGTVYEQTPAGRRPLANAWVTLDSVWGLGWIAADTVSDADGRYLLCGVQHGPSLSVVAGLNGYEVYYSGDLGGSALHDIEMRRLGN